jgi:HSP20 family protein
MTTLTLWHPFRTFQAVQAVQDEIDRVLGEQRRSDGARAETASAWRPAVDVVAHDDRTVLDVELPGVDPSKVEIALEGQVLTVRGERAPVEAEAGHIYTQETSYGRFARSFTLPSTVKRDAIEATYKLGVLRITLPHAEEAKPRQIPVQIAG